MMADFEYRGEGYNLIIEEQYHNKLDIESFSQMMKDPSYCYKFYWLEAIVQLISEGVQTTTFDPEHWLSLTEPVALFHRIGWLRHPGICTKQGQVHA